MRDVVFQERPGGGGSTTIHEILLEEVSLKSGPSATAQPLSFVPASVNIFVGPNHSGKSLLLREIALAVTQPSQAPRRNVLKEITFNPLDENQKASLADELRAAAQPSESNPAQNILLRKGQWKQEFGRDHFEQMLRQFPSVRDAGSHSFFRNFFLADKLLTLGGSERLQMFEGIKREPPSRDRYYVHLLSRLFYSDEKRKDVQSVIKDAFGLYFVIDALGENFEAKMSSTPPSPAVERSLSNNAVTFFAGALPMSQMSDGVRAFAGSVAAVIASDAKVILIDEPEAFLHPALCVNLAKELCRRARKNHQQLFIATHNAAFLLGCVQAGIDLNIIRLTYRDGAATSRVLPQDQIVPLMRQPLLRSIGALTGIFYESVIVTEADADRAFYDEVNHRCVNVGDARAIPDALFLNAQNWQTTA
jgi:predicted ATPase